MRDELLRKYGENFSLKKETLRGFSFEYIVGGQGPTLLLLHGANIGWGMWYKNLQKLSLKFTVVALNLPCAASFPNVASQDLIGSSMEMVKIFIKEVLGDRCEFAIGHSFGGYLILRLSIESYFKKIILVDSLGFTRRLPIKFWPITIKKVAILLSKFVMAPSLKNMKDFLCSSAAVKGNFDDIFTNYYYENVVRSGCHPFIFMNFLTRFARFKKELNMQNFLAKSRIESLVIWGKQDNVLPLSFCKKNLGLLKYSTLSIYQNCGHVPPIEQFEKFNGDVVNFFN